MNKNKLKIYAPQARRDFIAAVTQRAHLLGITATEILSNRRQGDVVIIDGREWPAKIGEQRQRLIQRIERDGFEPTMEAVAYTWFNRFAALRYMELHDYLGHGHRVLSNRDGGPPEILSHALDVELPGLSREKITELKLAGNRDGELYRLLLVAQCNALSAAMPFLFERIDDETELLLPDNLLRTDSVIAKLVEAISEEDWREVEIIGWLYQFYISEKKDQVIGKVVRAEDIPAATQLFTPNWIVKYLVQNSVGRLWLMANPASTLKSRMDYYVEPAEQTPEVQAQLDALIQARIDEDGGSLNPESITVLDPACGSGHILVEAYDLLKQIYLERGYQPRAIPRLILEKNLHGLDIDDRAAQMAGFALLMKARADDRRLLNDPPRLNVVAIQESKGLDIDELAGHLRPFGIERTPLKMLLKTFAQAKTFGSLIQIPAALDMALPALVGGLQQASASGDVFAQSTAAELVPLVWQASILAMKFDAVVANPPYMGGRSMNSVVKHFAKARFEPFKSDLFAMFAAKLVDDVRPSGFVALMTPFVWMFLSSYEALRRKLLGAGDIATLVRPEYHAFFDSAYVPICAFVLQKGDSGGRRLGIFFDLSDFYGYDLQPQKLREAIKVLSSPWRHEVHCSDFRKIPGWAIAYWLSPNALQAFEVLPPLSAKYEFRQGLATGANDRFLRYWHECNLDRIGFGMKSSAEAKRSRKKWFPCHKGGESRKWYGNNYFVVDWENDGEALKKFPGSVIRNPTYYFRPGVTWGSLTVSSLTMRYSPSGFIFESKGAVAFEKEGSHLDLLLSLANSIVMDHYLKVLSPTMDYSQGPLGRVPLNENCLAAATAIATEAVEMAREAWDSNEVSWDFRSHPLISGGHKSGSLRDSWKLWSTYIAEQILRMKTVEEKNNRLFIEAYGLQDELSPEVPEDQITLARADREKDCQRLISYAIGCMMGRYRLDRPGLIYAHAGSEQFWEIYEGGSRGEGLGVSENANPYPLTPIPLQTPNPFPPDADGIIPITDEHWFEGDAAQRISEFLTVVWPDEGVKEQGLRDSQEEGSSLAPNPYSLNPNLQWLAESLGRKGSETPEETIRRYLSANFFKDHLKTYKKRPIYWLFSSGKQKAFEALVYLHRYHEGTLARMRSEYVVPLTAKMLARIDMLQKDAEVASSASTRNKLNKRIESLKKKHLELLAFDEKLRHYADRRITIDLDDGVKVNYGKFGDLLAEVRAVTGGSGED